MSDQAVFDYIFVGSGGVVPRLCRENDAMRWDFSVRRYTSEALQEKDPKYVRDYRGVPVNGILNPRAGKLPSSSMRSSRIRSGIDDLCRGGAAVIHESGIPV